MNKITKITAQEILDSRGNPTIECEVFFEIKKGFFQKEIKKVSSSVPSGASIGSFEAYELRDNNQSRFNGRGVLQAIKNIEEKIAPKIIGLNVTKQAEIDQKMIKLDGTKNKSNLGANAILAVSMAVCRAGAMSKNKKLYEYIHDLFFQKSNFTANTKKNIFSQIPRAFFNVINGGEHAGNKLAFQEFMISPNLENFSENYRAATEIYQVLKNILKEKFGGVATLLGDEGGFAPQKLEQVEETLDLIMEAIKKANYENKVDIAFDIAASEFFINGKYNLGYKTAINNFKSVDELIEIYLNLSKKYPIISIEDPFDQQDFFAFSKLKQELKTNYLNIQVVSDDLTVSSSSRIEKAIQEKSCDTLLLKINQIGTITEAINSAQLAKGDN